MRLKITLGILVILVLIIFLPYIFIFKRKKAIATIQTFEECKGKRFSHPRVVSSSLYDARWQIFLWNRLLLMVRIYIQILFRLNIPNLGNDQKSNSIEGQARDIGF